MLRYRQNTLLKQTGSSAQASWASGYTVTAYGAGAVATANSSGAALTVSIGHSFAAGDKLLIDPGGDNTYSGSAVVQSVTVTSITMDGGTYAVTDGDIIVNLGADTGVAAPNYDASPLSIYSDPPGADAVTNSRVTCSSLGEYGYYHSTLPVWELVRDSGGTVVDIVFNDDVVASVAALPTASAAWHQRHLILLEADGSSEWVCLLDTDGTTYIWGLVA